LDAICLQSCLPFGESKLSVLCAFAPLLDGVQVVMVQIFCSGARSMNATEAFRPTRVKIWVSVIVEIHVFRARLVNGLPTPNVRVASAFVIAFNVEPKPNQDGVLVHHPKFNFQLWVLIQIQIGRSLLLQML
jgi:hypothetical protein